MCISHNSDADIGIVYVAVANIKRLTAVQPRANGIRKGRERMKIGRFIEIKVLIAAEAHPLFNAQISCVTVSIISANQC